MTKPLSPDLRIRIIQAVEVEGMSRRAAAEHFGVAPSTADITLAEIADHLFATHGERFVPSVVWRFFERRAISFKKNRARQRAGPAGRGGRARGMAGSSA